LGAESETLLREILATLKDIRSARPPTPYPFFYYSGTIASATSKGSYPEDLDIEDKFKRKSPMLWLANDGVGSLFVVVSHEKQREEGEVEVKPGELQLFPDVYYIRLRADKNNTKFRLSEQEIEPSLKQFMRGYMHLGYPLKAGEKWHCYLAICADTLGPGGISYTNSAYAFVRPAIPVAGSQVLYDIDTGEQLPVTIAAGRDSYLIEEWVSFDQPVRIWTYYIHDAIKDLQCIGHRPQYGVAVMNLNIPWGKTWFVTVDTDWEMSIEVENLGQEATTGKAWQMWHETVGRHPLAP